MAWVMEARPLVLLSPEDCVRKGDTMGIFSERCEALVNPVTGRALTGKALEEAKKEASWPRCGHSVKKAAKHCSKCGAPARGGWIKCPHCGEWVGNDSNFCWNCNTPLNPHDRSGLAGGVWHRTQGMYAQRFEADALTTTDGRDLQVQEGTVAILLSGGAFEDVLDAGQFKVESVARKINWFGNPPNRSMILVEAGECILPLAINGLPTKAEEDAPLSSGAVVDFYGEAVVRFAGGKRAAIAFIENAMKSAQELSFANLTERLTSLLGNVVRDVCATTRLSELLSEADIRVNLRKAMTKQLETELESLGLDLVRISSAEFSSRAYNELLQRSAALDEKRRKAECDMAFRNFEAELALDQFKTEHDIQAAKEALDAEYRLKDLERKEAWNRLMEERQDETMERRRARARVQQAQAEEERDIQRAKDAAEKIRLQKEEDEARIRKWALLEEEVKHTWTQEDANRDREWATEKEKLEHDEAVAAMVRRAGDAQREHDWQVAFDELLHNQKMDAQTTEYLIEKAQKTASGEISVKELHDEYDRKKRLESAKTDSAIDDIKRDSRGKDHLQKVKETGDWIKVKEEKRKWLLTQIEATKDPTLKQVLIAEYKQAFVGEND